MADPFADRSALDSNPFADPTVQGALSSSRFDADDGYSPAPYGLSGSSQKSAFEEDLPNMSSAAGVGAGGGGTSAQLEDIQRRERELQRREEELTQRAENIRKHGRNNWPFFFPLIYHDIASEIPPDSQQVMTHLYYLWLVLAATLIVNLVACIFLIPKGSDGIKDTITAAVFIPVISLTSFTLWYRPIYNGFMKEHALFYYLYFVCGCHLLWSVYVFLGIPSTGSAGLLNTIFCFTDETTRIVAGILGAITTAGFGLQGLGNLWYYRLIYKHNKQQGHTFAQAKAEFASHGAKAYFTRGSQV